MLQSRVADAPPDFVDPALCPARQPRIWSATSLPNLPRSRPEPGGSSASGSRGRRRSGSAPRRRPSVSGSRACRSSRSSMTTCRSWSIPSMAELAEQGFDAHLVVHPRFAVERDPAGKLLALPASPAAGAERHPGKRHPGPRRSHRRSETSRTPRHRRSPMCSPRSGAPSRTGAHAGAGHGAHRASSRSSPPALPVDEIAEVHPVPRMADGRQFHLPRRSRLQLRRRRRCPHRDRGVRARRPARPRGRRDGGRRRAARADAARGGGAQRAQDAHHHQDQFALARASAHRDGSRRGQAL